MMMIMMKRRMKREEDVADAAVSMALSIGYDIDGGV